MALLKYQYAPADPDLPEWGEDLPKYAPCRLAWTPPMCSTAEQQRQGGLIPGEITVPWEWNLAQIQVQSRKAYELLSRTPKPLVSRPVVCIDPPQVRIDGDCPKQFDVLVCSYRAGPITAHLAAEFDCVQYHADSLWSCRSSPPPVSG